MTALTSRFSQFASLWPAIVRSSLLFVKTMRMEWSTFLTASSWWSGARRDLDLIRLCGSLHGRIYGRVNHERHPTDTRQAHADQGRKMRIAMARQGFRSARASGHGIGQCVCPDLGEDPIPFLFSRADTAP